MAPGLQTHGQRVAPRNSTHSYALDNTFRFIDGMTEFASGCFGLRWLLVEEKRSWGVPPTFSAHVRLGEHGAPVLPVLASLEEWRELKLLFAPLPLLSCAHCYPPSLRSGGCASFNRLRRRRARRWPAPFDLTGAGRRLVGLDDGPGASWLRRRSWRIADLH